MGTKKQTKTEPKAKKPVSKKKTALKPGEPVAKSSAEAKERKTVLKSQAAKTLTVAEKAPQPSEAEIVEAEIEKLSQETKTVIKFNKETVAPLEKPLNVNEINEHLKKLKSDREEHFRLTAEMTARIKEVEERYSEKLYTLSKGISEVEKQIVSSLATDIDGIFGNLGSFDLESGTISKKESTELLTKNESESIKLIAQNYKSRIRELLRLKLELDKNALKKLSQSELVVIGMELQNNINLSIEV